MKRLLVLIPIAALFAIWWWQSHRSGQVGWQGYAEADYLRIGPTIEGRLVSLSVERGDEVRAGDILFAQDPVDDDAARDQARAALRQAQSQLANLQGASKATEIRVAEADVVDAQANVLRAGKDLARYKALAPGGAVTRQDVDLMVQTARSADARLASAVARRDQARAPTGRAQEIDAADRAAHMAEAGLRRAEWRLSQRQMRAPEVARVADIYARPGEMMPAGTPVVELLPPGNILVRFFVPEGEIGHMHAGEAVRIGCDGCAAPIEAHVSFVAPQAEYTPPVIYSNETRAKLVFLVEARPAPRDATRLNPGQPVTVLPERGE